MALTDVQGTTIGERGLGSTAYEHDYFSGSQIQVMIGDVLVDTAVHISMQVHQNKTPVYGYANQYYSFLADGEVIVTGQLVVAFKESGYFLYALKRFNEFATAGEWQTPRYHVDKSGILRREPDSETDLSKFETVAKAAQRKRTMRANVEQTLDWETVQRSGTKEEKKQARRNNNRFVKTLGALKDDAFEEWAETFEDAIWYGTDIQHTSLRDKVNSGNIREKTAIEPEDLLSHRRADQYPAVDIWVIYGDTDNHAANHTVQKLLDVSFMGSSKTISVSGEPVYESYPFVARNLV